MPPTFPHGEHPDGDPFAEADRLAALNTPLGRLEAKALAEQEREQQRQRSQSTTLPTATTSSETPKAARGSRGASTAAAAVASASGSGTRTSGRRGGAAAGQTSPKAEDIIIIDDDSDIDSQRLSAPVSVPTSARRASQRKGGAQPTAVSTPATTKAAPEPAKPRSKAGSGSAKSPTVTTTGLLPDCTTSASPTVPEAAAPSTPSKVLSPPLQTAAAEPSPSSPDSESRSIRSDSATIQDRLVAAGDRPSLTALASAPETSSVVASPSSAATVTPNVLVAKPKPKSLEATASTFSAERFPPSSPSSLSSVQASSPPPPRAPTSGLKDVTMGNSASAPTLNPPNPSDANEPDDNDEDDGDFHVPPEALDSDRESYGSEADSDDGEDGEGGSEAESVSEDGDEEEGDGEGEGEGEGSGDEEEDDEDDDEDDDDEDSDEEGDVSVAVDTEMPSTNAEGGLSTTAVNGDGTADPAAVNTLVAKKPKVKRQRRASSSPPPEPQKPKAPPRVIRLELTLPRNVTDVPEYSVAQLSKEAGYGSEDDAPGAQGEKKEGGSASEEEEGSGESGSESDGQGGRRKVKGKGKEIARHEAADGDAMMEGVEATNGEVKAGGEGESGEPPMKKRKRASNKILGRFGGYDTNDPFVDDTELGFYEPKFYHRPKRDGFFVCTGTVELISGRRGRIAGSKNKPKYDKDGNPIPATTVEGIQGRRKPGPKPRNPAAVVGGAFNDPSAPAFGTGAPLPPVNAPPPPPKRKVKGEHSPELQREFAFLKEQAAKADFSVKSKFPPELRPLIVDVALNAIKMGEYDDDFFAELPKIFPYNNFTMKKLTKREVFPRRMELMTLEQEKHFQTLRDGIADQLPKQQEEFMRNHAQWEQDMIAFTAAKKAQTETGGLGSAPAPPAIAAVTNQSAPAGHPTSEAGLGEDGAADSPAPGETDTGYPPEPKWKFRFTEAMRLALYWLYTIEEQRSELYVEKQNLEKSVEQGREKAYSHLNAKKILYAKVNDLWPADTMSTNQLSREMSLTKKKVEKGNEAEG